ncbi:MAG: efflux RND transporter periplasmic adaptor subunit [Acidobacteria bacterium]|nr:efflux RND transporter periplasmic adaptor subunit [Acidobacteriota bacterium]
MKRNSVVKYGVAGVLGLAILFAGYSYWKRKGQDPHDKYLTVQIDRGNVRRTVSSTGTLQAVVTVQVGSQVSGRIQELHADFNSVVKKGQVLAIIDPASFQAQRERSQAQLATAQASVKNADANLVNRRAELSSAKANVEVARVALKEAERQQKRAQGLFKDGLIAERDLETAQATFEQAGARVMQAEAQVNQTEATIRSALSQQEQAAANVKQARAELTMSDVNLRYTNIISPIDGVVIERSVDIGQTVAASFQAPLLFLIANDLTKMQVIAQIDEADIGALSEKARVEFAVDAFPGQTFRGQIAEIRLTSKLPASSTSAGSSGSSGGGGTASNVVVYNVMIDVDNPALKLRPGMTANVNFTVASSDNILKVANSALRYRPSDKNPEEIQKLLSSLSGEVSANTGRPEPTGSAAASAPPQGSSGGFGASGRGGGSGRRMRGWQVGDGSGDNRMGGGERSWQGRGGGRSGGGAQAVIGPSKTDIYGIDAGMKIRFPQAEESRPTPGMIWVLDSAGQPQPRRVMLGITNGRETALVSGDLKEGDTVITGELGDEEATPQRGNTGSPFGRTPFGGGGGGGRRGGGR